MEMYAWLGPGAYNFPTSPLFWGAVIFVALLVAACLLVGKRNRRRFDGRPTEKGHTKDPRFEPSPFDRTLADIWHETDEFPLTDQNRKQRKAIKERRKAHEIAQKRGKGSD